MRTAVRNEMWYWENFNLPFYEHLVGFVPMAAFFLSELQISKHNGLKVSERIFSSEKRKLNFCVRLCFPLGLHFEMNDWAAQFLCVLFAQDSLRPTENGIRTCSRILRSAWMSISFYTRIHMLDVRRFANQKLRLREWRVNQSVSWHTIAKHFAWTLVFRPDDVNNNLAMLTTESLWAHSYLCIIIIA